ncbi:MAG: hypothetical protein HUJ26_06820 [Planctomycetaceae bacterium]|nr:hypothetical protein [Planctomycetaceae bacterium]
MFRLILAGLICSFSCLSASAQGLIWSLPEDGQYVTYTGSYTLTDVQEGTKNEDINTSWERVLTIKSVGKADADYQGESTACRWVEFKLIDAKTEDTQLVAGPVGEVIYKVLIPESGVVGSVTDANDLFVNHIPIVRGYRKVGAGQVETLPAGALQVYPVLTLLMHYREVTSEGDENVDAPNIQTAEKLTAKKTIESREIRIINNALMWRNTKIPFGLVKWEVTQVREKKAATEPRSNFTKISEVKTTMTLDATGDGAQSDLPDNN